MIGDENFTPNPPQPKFDFRHKKRGTFQIREKYNQLRFGSNFQGNLRPIKDGDWRLKFLSPLSQNLNLGKKQGEGKQIQIQPTQICPKVSLV